MNGSPKPKHPHPSHKHAEATQVQRPCDYCGDSTALLYCRADSAKLCLSCDREVHSTNQLFSKHTRTQLCDACGDSPATILCSTENSVLCQNCDWERRNLLISSVHERRPLEGFTGCPSVTELLTILGFEDISKKALLSTEGRESFGVDGDRFLGSEIEGLSDMFVWDTPSVVGLEDLIASTGSAQSYQAMVVPPLYKNRKAACGRQKEEILSQLGELAKLEPLIVEDIDAEGLSTVHGLVPENYVQPGNLSTVCELEADIFPSCEAGVFGWHKESSAPANQVVPYDTSPGVYSEQVQAKYRISAVCETQAYGNNEGKPSNSFHTDNLSTTPKATPYELTSQERDSALLRYKEKKKTRRYDNHIRYESRKVHAESRIRIRGRFAKDGTQKL